MGAYVTRNGKTYYKADDGKLYQNYGAAAAANSNPVAQVQRFAGNLWGAADRALGGFLPGGGTPNALTRGYGRPPEAVRAVAERAGVDPSSFKFANLSTNRPLLNQAAQLAGRTGLNPWGEQGFAYTDPAAGPVIGLYGGTGSLENAAQDLARGSTRNPATVAHELGHLFGDKKGQFTPDLGRAAQVFNRMTGGNIFSHVAASALLRYGDAPAEDAAERFARQYAGQADSGKVYPDGTSDYGNRLRKEADSELRQGIYNLFGLNPLVRRGLSAAGSTAVGALTKNAPAVSDWLLNTAVQAATPKEKQTGELSPVPDFLMKASDAVRNLGSSNQINGLGTYFQNNPEWK